MVERLLAALLPFGDALAMLHIERAGSLEGLENITGLEGPAARALAFRLEGLGLAALDYGDRVRLTAYGREELERRMGEIDSLLRTVLGGRDPYAGDAEMRMLLKHVSRGGELTLVEAIKLEDRGLGRRSHRDRNTFILSDRGWAMSPRGRRMTKIVSRRS